MIIGNVLPYFNLNKIYGRVYELRGITRLWPYANQAENRNFPTFSKKKKKILKEKFMNIYPTC
jgi:hypothetical protein